MSGSLPNSGNDAGTRPKVICLMGATATGKTDLAVALTEHLPCELVSVDSALIYKGMDIGTAKPEPEVLAKAPHRLIDIRDPAESYSAADFRADALRAIGEIHQQGKMAVLVGGTMLYFKALLEGLADLPEADEFIRAEILKQAQEQGWDAVHTRLALVDPESARRIHRNDPQRLQRALEVYLATGRSLTSMWSEQKNQGLGFDVVQLAVEHPERAVLHQRIEQRFDMMLAAGFEDEVRLLYQREDLNPSLPSIRCVGYRQMWSYLDHEFDYDTMRERAIIATRQLAKRQLTWLRGWSDLHRLDVTQPDLLGNALKIIDDCLI